MCKRVLPSYPQCLALAMFGEAAAVNSCDGSYIFSPSLKEVAAKCSAALHAPGWKRSEWSCILHHQGTTPEFQLLHSWRQPTHNQPQRWQRRQRRHLVRSVDSGPSNRGTLETHPKFEVKRRKNMKNLVSYGFPGHYHHNRCKRPSCLNDHIVTISCSFPDELLGDWAISITWIWAARSRIPELLMVACPQVKSGWCLTYPSEKYEFVNGKDDIPYMKWKINIMFQTTNQKSYNTSQKEFFFILLSVAPLTSEVQIRHIWNSAITNALFTDFLLEDILTNLFWEGLESKVVTGISGSQHVDELGKNNWCWWIPNVNSQREFPTLLVWGKKLSQICNLWAASPWVLLSSKVVFVSNVHGFLD